MEHKHEPYHLFNQLLRLYATAGQDYTRRSESVAANLLLDVPLGTAHPLPKQTNHFPLAIEQRLSFTVEHAVSAQPFCESERARRGVAGRV